MKATTNNYFVETSALGPALGSPSQLHNDHFTQATHDGHLSSSLYVRKEFIFRRILNTINVAITINNSSAPTEGLYYRTQDFGRDPKNTLETIIDWLGHKGTIKNTKLAAEEIGRNAVHLLREFDKVFRNLIPNSSQCQIGSRLLEVDFNNLFRDLAKFYKDYKQPIKDCKVNEFLGHKDGTGTARLLVDNEKLKTFRNLEKLREYSETKQHITCTECQKIGDAIIALEQTVEVVLIHIDRAFDRLCPALNKKNKRIESAKAIENRKTASESNEGDSP